MGYTFEDHIHNFAVWTAARAVQRSFTTTDNISKVISGSGLREIEKADIKSEEGYADFHIKCANKIIDGFKNLGINSSYGRAAKIISIYLKTAIIIRDRGQGTLCQLIHPPIDSILLKSIARNKKCKEILAKPWTKLEKDDYWSLVVKLKTIFPEFNWKVEEHWKPERDDKGM